MHRNTYKGFALKLHKKPYDTLETIDFWEKLDIDPNTIKDYFGENLNNLHRTLKQLTDFKIDYTLSRNVMTYFKPEFDAAPPDVKAQIKSMLGDDPYLCYQHHFELLVQIVAVLNHHDPENVYRYHYPETPNPELKTMVDAMVSAYIKMQVQLRKENIEDRYIRLTVEKDDPGMTTPIELAALNQPGHTFIESIVHDFIDKRIPTMPEKIIVYAIAESRLYIWTISDRYREAMRK